MNKTDLENIESLLNEMTQQLNEIAEAIGTRNEKPLRIFDADIIKQHTTVIDPNEHYEEVYVYSTYAQCFTKDREQRIIPLANIKCIDAPREKAYTFDA